ncbi:MAG: DUF6498-containing protein [Candidatus Uhrbacteria bacterium]
MSAFSLTDSQIKKTKLILINLIPLLGVLFFDWSLFLVFFYYWLENCLVGLSSAGEMLMLSFWWRKIRIGLASTAFFIFHYGGFMVGHLFLLVFFFATNDPIFERFVWPSWPLFWFIFLNFIPVLLGYGISLIRFYQAKDKTIRLGKLIFNPYRRLLVVHLTLLLGGLVAASLGAPILSLAVLIGLKLAFDWWSEGLKND